MYDLSEPVVQAFCNELQKEAGFTDLVSKAAPYLKSTGALAGAGGVAGGLLGAGTGALRGAHAAHQEGGSTLSGALQGAAQGALSGAGVGAAGGALAGAIGGKHINPNWLTQRNGMLGAGARFGQRQVHAVTGMLSPKELEAVRGGAYAARQHASASVGKVNEAFGKGAPAQKVHEAVNHAVSAQRGLQASEASQNMGLTSIPGYLRAVQQHGVGKVLSTSMRDQFHNTPKALSALMVGAPLVGAAKTLTSPEDPSKGKGEQLGQNLGESVGGVIGGAMPLAGGMLAAGALREAGGAIGRGVDKLRGRPRLVPANPYTLGPPQLEQAESQNTSTERVLSNSAAGLPPEGLS